MHYNLLKYQHNLRNIPEGYARSCLAPVLQFRKTSEREGGPVGSLRGDSWAAPAGREPHRSLPNGNDLENEGRVTLPVHEAVL
jgi:hypothetical protein